MGREMEEVGRRAVAGLVLAAAHTGAHVVSHVLVHTLPVHGRGQPPVRLLSTQVTARGGIVHFPYQRGSDVLVLGNVQQPARGLYSSIIEVVG